MEQTTTSPDEAVITPPGSVKDKIKAQWAKMIALVSIVAIALGGLNDTLDAIDKVTDIVLSKFTDIPSQSNLEKIYIRASADVLEETFGAPVYMKTSYTGNVIRYYKDNRFIISAIVKEGYIAAYLVFPDQSFTPNTFEHAGGEALLSVPLAAQESVSELKANVSTTITYYIEANPAGTFSNLYASISGYSQFLGPLDPQSKQQLFKLAEELVLDDLSTTTIESVRQKLVPNFFGYSTLSLVTLEQAVLSQSEYRLINKEG